MIDILGTKYNREQGVDEAFFAENFINRIRDRLPSLQFRKDRREDHPLRASKRLPLPSGGGNSKNDPVRF
jgi:hypothetical protein